MSPFGYTSSGRAEVCRLAPQMGGSEPNKLSSYPAGCRFPLFFPLFPLLFPPFKYGRVRHPNRQVRQIVQPSKGLYGFLP